MIFIIGTALMVCAGVIGVVLSVKKGKRRKVNMNDENIRKKPKFGNTGYKPPVYNPKIQRQEDLQRGLRDAIRSKEEKSWEPQRAGSYPNIRKTPQKPLFQTRLPEPEPEPPVEQEEEEEPYWDAEEWEDWAYQIYLNYPEVRQFLPDWFIKALEAEMQKQTETR